MSKKILIKEFASGDFQVWRGAKVLRPESKTWTGADTTNPTHYFSKLDDAMEAAADVLEKEQEVAIYDYDQLLIDRAAQAEKDAAEDSEPTE